MVILPRGVIIRTKSSKNSKNLFVQTAKLVCQAWEERRSGVQICSFLYLLISGIYMRWEVVFLGGGGGRPKRFDRPSNYLGEW